jgi:hypothetical protein
VIPVEIHWPGSIHTREVSSSLVGLGFLGILEMALDKVKQFRTSSPSKDQKKPRRPHGKKKKKREIKKGPPPL